MTKLSDLSVAVRHARGITLERLDSTTRMYIEALEAIAAAEEREQADESKDP